MQEKLKNLSHSETSNSLHYVNHSNIHRPHPQERAHSPPSKQPTQTTNSTQSSEIEQVQQTNPNIIDTKNDEKRFRVQITSIPNEEKKVVNVQKKKEQSTTTHVKKDTLSGHGLPLICEDEVTPNHAKSVNETFGTLKDRVLKEQNAKELIISNSMMSSESDKIRGVATPDTWDKFDRDAGILADHAHFKEMMGHLEEGVYAGSYDD